MSRWIDADVLPRHGQRGGLVHWKDIENAPSIDIVRCKECKWWIVAMDENNSDEDYLKCNMDKWTNADDFCSYVERRE